MSSHSIVKYQEVQDVQEKLRTKTPQIKDKKKLIGFIVNPIAGMGGKVGLKGTDNVVKEAIKLGAEPIAPKKALIFLKKLVELQEDDLGPLLVCPTPMGEAETKEIGILTRVIDFPRKEITTSKDTKMAVNAFLELGVDLIVFVGGDGTARDILEGLENSSSIQVIGVPSGVKMYSGIFTRNPVEAAEVVVDFLRGTTQSSDFEIMDVDEEAFREDQFSIKIFGYLRGPFIPGAFQGSKVPSPSTLLEHENQLASARFFIEEVKPDVCYILGPGTTLRTIAELLGVEKSLLGVDLYRDGTLIKDVNEDKILKEIKSTPSSMIVVSPIGNQGMIFGRGNQQISPEVIKLVGRDNIRVIATKSKLQRVQNESLWVDTGDQDIDKYLKGFMKVIIDYREWRMVRIE